MIWVIFDKVFIFLYIFVQTWNNRCRLLQNVSWSRPVFIVSLIAFFTLLYPIYATNILLRRGLHGKFLSRAPSNKNKEIPCLCYLSFKQVVSWRHTHPSRSNCCMNHCHHHQFYSFIFVFLQQYTSQCFNSFFWFLTCILCVCVCVSVFWQWWWFALRFTFLFW